MAYKALYNKYRPQTFEEVAGQRAIVRTLRNAIANDKIAHAYLFCGPRGTGKTTMARLFAKALNCEEGIGHQCNKCESCVELNQGSHPDVFEIDGASNNGVDQARELIDQVRYAPIKGRYKIYIIDEVHMMSQGAFNALLKTLEEPPAHVVFILATTEPYKVLPTILSRCQRYDFGKIEDADIKAKLIWILQQENVEFEDAALNEIVTLADGGMRDALSILDQALAYGGNVLKEQDVLTVFGLTSITEKVALLSLISSGDVSATLEKLSTLFQAGIDIRRLTGSMLDILKDLIIFNRTKNPTLLQTLPEKDAMSLAAKISIKKANALIDILLKAQRDFKTVSNIRSLFELMILQMTSLFGEEEPAATISAKKDIPAEAVEPKQETTNIPEPEPSEGVYTGTSAPSFFDEPDVPLAPKKPEEEIKTPIVAEKPEEEIKATLVEAKPIEESKPVEEPKAPVVEEKPLPGKLDFSSVPDNPIVKTGTPVPIVDNDIIQIMVLSYNYKQERKELREKWSLLEEAALDPRIGDAAQLLHDGSPFCLCENALIVSYDYAPLANQAGLEENKAVLSAIASVLAGHPIQVYATNRENTIRCRNLFFQLQQVGKLPKAEDIKLHLPE